ncbi:MAG: DNA/RNA nuclease SfsA [Methanobacteriaceae archaeon]|nr:DNA/RNA nuclease SfsA [Methanobacteriaceae archaeon]MDP2835542.1 DNA/RNA nuclease SfsA [Methanobacteriaceae archaeon]MDP3486284.1 DNA/RNA nuclease SfsA [Methanobacteriaceae archaeon]MDP3624816.1 DNA/RNA nuclease SfsA [Methanobacteriaceae archaeon]
MQIKELIEGIFLERPNRFTVLFQDRRDSKDADPKMAHLRDPGRLKELLYPGAKLILRKAVDNPKRKTKFDVIGVFKDNLWVLINSGFHSDLAAELIESGLVDEFKGFSIERREYAFGKSRLDFLLKPNDDSMPDLKKMLVEVKGCTLVEDEWARFPDAPTIRGKKHVEELIYSLDKGFESSVLFLILKEDAKVFSPNNDTDPDFSSALQEAQEKGVNIIPFVFKTENINGSLIIKPIKKINVDFKKIMDKLKNK